jgi:hypothetical protein
LLRSAFGVSRNEDIANADPDALSIVIGVDDNAAVIVIVAA